MLYDTPYPTEPQNDLVPQKANRNADIITRYEASETGDSIDRVFGISEQRINQISSDRSRDIVIFVTFQPRLNYNRFKVAV
jgi:hypothetical protein